MSDLQYYRELKSSLDLLSVTVVQMNSTITTLSNEKKEQDAKISSMQEQLDEAKSQIAHLMSLVQDDPEDSQDSVEEMVINKALKKQVSRKESFLFVVMSI